MRLLICPWVKHLLWLSLGAPVIKCQEAWKVKINDSNKKTSTRHAKRHRSQPERAPNGQNWNNLRNKTSNYSTHHI